jgi:hypothetical protein
VHKWVINSSTVHSPSPPTPPTPTYLHRQRCRRSQPQSNQPLPTREQLPFPNPSLPLSPELFSRRALEGGCLHYCLVLRPQLVRGAVGLDSEHCHHLQCLRRSLASNWEFNLLSEPYSVRSVHTVKVSHPHPITEYSQLDTQQSRVQWVFSDLLYPPAAGLSPPHSCCDL